MKALKFLSIFLISTFVQNTLSAGIVCPPNVNIMCYDDIHYLPQVGVPTVFGYPSEILEYYDQSSNTMCASGDVTRIWYLDLNQNQQHDTGEHSCVQHIYVQHIDGNVSVTFPQDKVYSCKEDIEFEAPDWSSGPCDMMAYSFNDLVYNGASDACYKILRNFTVINWCTYENNPQGEGVWTHTQVIKVVETTKPVIKNCADITLSVSGADCKATFQISNSASDVGDCISHELEWIVDVDLWGDGIVEYTFSKSEPYPFTLKPTKNGEAISILLPEKAPIGLHKVTWKVKDKCNNYTNCLQKVVVKDTKAPTPYLHPIISAAFTKDMAPLKFPARMFNIDSYDNCTQKSMLRYSFSPNVNDSLKLIQCSNSGFQFWTVYVTDMAGNQSFTNVFALVFDNGSCNMRQTLQGQLKNSNRSTIAPIQLIAERSDHSMTESTTAQNDGSFEFNAFPLYDDFTFSIESKPKVDKKSINVLDLIMLQDYIFGDYNLTNFQFPASDINADGKINVYDVVELRDLILDSEKESDILYYFDVDTISKKEEVKSLKNQLNIKAFDGFIDITGVAVGDISDANEVSSESRSTTTLYMLQNASTIDIIPQNDEVWQGFQLKLNIPSDIIDLVEVSSGGLIHPNQIIKDVQNHSITILYPEAIAVSNHNPIISLHYSGLTPSEVGLDPSSIIVKNGYQASRVVGKYQRPMLQPNPNNGTFTIFGVDAIHSVVNVLGQPCAFEQNGNRITLSQPAGIYFIMYSANGKAETTTVSIE